MTLNAKKKKRLIKWTFFAWNESVPKSRSLPSVFSFEMLTFRIRTMEIRPVEKCQISILQVSPSENKHNPREIVVSVYEIKYPKIDVTNLVHFWATFHRSLYKQVKFSKTNTFADKGQLSWVELDKLCCDSKHFFFKVQERSLFVSLLTDFHSVIWHCSNLHLSHS